MRKILCCLMLTSLFVCHKSTVGLGRWYQYFKSAKEVETKISGPQQSGLEKERKNFNPFEHVMGISEAEFKTRSLADQKKFLQNGFLINEKTKKRFAVGTFEQKSIQVLRAQVAQKKQGPGCTFHVIEGYDKAWEHWFRDKVDITALQADSNNKDAVFQVASNFNALEGGGSPKAGIMSYLSPGLYVQGEAAVLSAMPGIIDRNYYVQHEVNGTTYQGQREKQINFLQQFSLTNRPFIPVNNGYLGTINDIDMFANATDEQMRAYEGRVLIGFHEGIQVIGGLGPQKSELPHYKAIQVNDESQRVNQVFAAAMMNPSWNNKGEEKLARMLLNAAYEGILSFSHIKQKNKVFLTLIGGGVFHNKLSWIADAIDRAVRESLNKGNMQINLVVHYSQGYDPSDWDYLKTKMLGLVNASNGTYTRYKQDGVHQVDGYATQQL